MKGSWSAERKVLVWFDSKAEVGWNREKARPYTDRSLSV
ncbi:hypothetical protein ADIAL_2055 [Alkalibacterium sp. AK22]|nr:hypothetical protein ADIAL_2055 [Alkalibacterium sp. AK22]